MQSAKIEVLADLGDQADTPGQQGGCRVGRRVAGSAQGSPGAVGILIRRPADVTD